MSPARRSLRPLPSLRLLRSVRPFRSLRRLAPLRPFPSLRQLAALTVLLASASLASASMTSAATPRASLLDIERQVMCVTCKIPLNVAESPQADRERAYIQGLIDAGQDPAQIKRALVSQYGPAVLALPGDHGFDLAAYLVPILAFGGVLLLLVLMLPRWRRRTRARGPAGASVPQLSPTDASRLEEDLARFDV